MKSHILDPVYILRRENDTFHSLQFTNIFQEEQLLSGSEVGQVLTWNLSSGRVHPTPPLMSGASTCLSVSVVDDTLVTQDKMGLIKIWSPKDNVWTLRDEFKSNFVGFCKAAVSNSLGGIVACPKEKGGLEVVLVNSGKKVAVFEHLDDLKVGEVMACKIVDKGGVPYAIAAYESGDVAVWDFKTLNIVSQLRVTGTDCPMAFDYDETKGRGVCGSSSNKVVVFKTDDRMELSLRHEFLSMSEGVGSIRIRPDKKVFAVGSWDGRIRVFSMKTCRPLALFDNHKATILDMSFAPFPVASHEVTSLMAASSRDGKISLIDVSM